MLKSFVVIVLMEFASCCRVDCGGILWCSLIGTVRVMTVTILSAVMTQQCSTNGTCLLPVPAAAMIEYEQEEEIDLSLG